MSAETVGNINLSDEGYFKKIDDLLKKYNSNYGGIDENGNTIHTADTKETDDVKALAKEIVESISQKVTDTLSDGMKDHYDRAARTADGTGVIVYDYRDKDKLTTFANNDSDNDIVDSRVRTDSIVHLLESQSMIKEGETITYESPLHIECGAKAENYILLDLPFLSTSALGINGYQINKYDIKEDTSSPEYQKALQEYKDSKQINSRTETRTGYNYKTITPPRAPIYGTINGERAIIQAANPGTYKLEPYTYTVTINEAVYTKPKPVGKLEKKYNPDSLDLIDRAIATVSARRSELGAMHNRLEHAYNINANVSENTSSAESKLRDTDMATEMVNYSKHNILEQAGQSMLSQANAINQGVLTLLQ